MGWIEAIVQALKIIGMVLGWWKEKSDEKKKAKGEVLRNVFKEGVVHDQNTMRKLINQFNAVDR